MTEGLSGVENGVCTPEKSPTTPQWTLLSCRHLSGIGELGADGSCPPLHSGPPGVWSEDCSTVVGELLRETEHLIAPDFTSFLWVLQIWLYCLLKLLDGGNGGKGLVLHSTLAVAVSGALGRSSAKIVGLWDLWLGFPVRSSPGPNLLLTTPCSSFPKLFWWEIVPEQLYNAQWASMRTFWPNVQWWPLTVVEGVAAGTDLQLLVSGVLLVLDPG